MKFSFTLWRKLVLLHETMVVVGVVAFGCIANEIVSGAVQSQYARFIEIHRKAAKIFLPVRKSMARMTIPIFADNKMAILSLIDITQSSS